MVRFDDDVRVAPGNAAVRNGDGSILGGKPAAHGKTLVLPLRANLGRGDYSVRWSAVSDDGHVVQGVIAFGVGLGRPPPVADAPPDGRGRLRDRALGAGSSSRGCSSHRALRCSICSCGGRSRRAICVREWIAIGLAAMFVSSHGLVHASHGGASTRFGLAIYIGSAVAATGAAAAAIGSPTDRRRRSLLSLAVAGSAGADRCGSRARPGPLVARGARRSPARDRGRRSGSAASSRWRSSRRARARRPRWSVPPRAASRSLALASVVVLSPHRRGARARGAVRSVTAVDDRATGEQFSSRPAFSRCCSASARCRVRASPRESERLRSVVLRARCTILLLGVVVAVALLTSLPARSSLDPHSGGCIRLSEVRRLRWGSDPAAACPRRRRSRRAASDHPIPTPRPTVPEARFLSVSTDHPFLRDRPLLATVSPNGDGLPRLRRLPLLPDRALRRIKVRRRRRAARSSESLSLTVVRAAEGDARLADRPLAAVASISIRRLYAIVLTVSSGRQSLRYGRVTRGSGDALGPIVRVLGISAAFDKSSYAPGETAQLTVSSDAVGLTVRIVDVAGSEVQPTVNRLDGPDVVEPSHYPWEANRDNSVTVPRPDRRLEAGRLLRRALERRRGRRLRAADRSGAELRTAASRCSSPTRRGLRTTSTTTIATASPTRGTRAAPTSLTLGAAVRAFRACRGSSARQMWPFLRWARLHAGRCRLPRGGRRGRSSALSLPARLRPDRRADAPRVRDRGGVRRRSRTIRDQGGDLIFLASNDLYWKVDIDGVDASRSRGGASSAVRVGARRRAVRRLEDRRRRSVRRRRLDRGRAGRSRERASSPAALFSFAGSEFDVTTAASPPGTQVLRDRVRTATIAVR